MDDEKVYYHAYDERYKTIHARGQAWAGDVPTPIVLATLERYGVPRTAAILEVGCGEGRDARAVLDAGYRLTVTDVSPEAIAYCRRTYPAYADGFATLDCLRDTSSARYAAIYVVSAFIIGGLMFGSFLAAYLSPAGIIRRYPVVWYHLAGLLCSLAGAAFFAVRRPYMHAVFHVLVLVGPMLCMVGNLRQLS